MARCQEQKRCRNVLIGLAGFIIFYLGSTTELYAATMFIWDRNIEVDLEHYEMYMCNTSSTCVPGITPADRLGADIAQTPIGTKPTMLFPPGKQGRAAVLAVDLVGNKSGLSNVIPFVDAQAPTVPLNLLTQ